jgi:hypothetical protein|tara:strand:- start:14443 stop:14688 length:246 start_codon:yes stop_codon:yes gene_type:complete
MDLNSAIKVLIDSTLKAQEKGLYSWYESRNIANAVDAIEEISRHQQELLAAQHAKNQQPVAQVTKKENGQTAIPPVARPQE